MSPEEVWIEAIALAFKLKKIDQTEVSMSVKELFEDLCDQYMCFREDDGSTTKRDLEQSLHSAMMVSFAAFLLLLNVHPNADGHPYTDVCQTIGEILADLKGFKELYEETRREEDDREKQGKFIEVIDYIEQLSTRETPISFNQLEYTHHVLGQIVDENKQCDISTMLDNERILSRVNDLNDHLFQPEVDMLRQQIKEVQGNDGQNVEYKNYIFAQIYEDKVRIIRQTIYPFVFNGVYHIDPKEQRQWLAIIEPLKLIDGLLIVHEDRKVHKECTNGEICQQLQEFFAKDLPSLDFDKVPKSISFEKSKWKEANVGFTFDDWKRYAQSRTSDRKYIPLAEVSYRLYGELKKVIKG
ncbi:MAG: hypothetical protein K6F74_01410 [Prevotella sp.]|nr:hypothetical protein [Prevotella sp.]